MSKMKDKAVEAKWIHLFLHRENLEKNFRLVYKTFSQRR